MAPNAEEDLLVSMPRGPHSAKERMRPPTYNPEDYAMALRRWGRRANAGQQEVGGQGTLPSTCTSSSSGYASAANGEMTLRQFTSVSELLNKLRADLSLAFPSFVQEFASPPAEGISLLLETLRGVQLSQCAPPTSTGPRRPRARRAALDELGCVECLAACAERCPDAVRTLGQAQPGLLALAVCLTSSLNRSRVLALQLLTRVCGVSGGHAAVSEAVSTLRLRYGEGGRFRFLAGALLASKAATALRLAGLAFLNAFLSSAPRAQTKLYIQAEACEAGLEPRVLQEWLRHADDDDELTEPLREEVHKWSRHCVDVDALQGRARRAEETCRALSKKVSALQRQLQTLQLERLNQYNSATDGASNPKHARVEVEKKVSSSAEDEGISFSERSSSPEEQVVRTAPNVNGITDNDQETTIDDVIEELRIIVKDAEDELHDWNQLQESSPRMHKSEFGKNVALSTSSPAKGKNNYGPSKARESLRNSEESARIDRDLKVSGSLKIVVPGPQRTPRDMNEEEDNESAIVPAIIHPQPPRRAPPCIVGDSLFLQHHQQPLDQVPVLEVCVDSDHDEELLLLDDDGSDSLLSASRLNYHGGTNSAPKSLHHPYHKDDSHGIYQRRRSLSSSDEYKVEGLTDFEISETVLDERVSRKRADSSEHGQLQQSNSLGSRQYSKCSNTVQRRTERRKYLRRCQSQEHMEPAPSSGRRGVIEQIRKFESLNSFDDRRSLAASSDGPLRRSESFHQTRLSDSGLESRGQRAGPGRQLVDERKVTSFSDKRSRDKLQQPSDPRIFAGRPHDVLSFGRNRFNAGKYSGNAPLQQFAPKQAAGHRHASHQQQHMRAKVTDIVSGLY